VLTAEQEAAHGRFVDRLTAIATLGDPLTRWAMGTPRGRTWSSPAARGDSHCRRSL
jgi:hypothetical protein